MHAASPLLYVRTLRHLQPRQLAYLPARRLVRSFGLSRPRRVRATLDECASDGLRALWRMYEPADRNTVLTAADAALAGRFAFLNNERVLMEPRWGERHGSPLWSFHLQYGSYIEDLARAHEWTSQRQVLLRLIELVTSWIAAAKPAASDAWAPYVVAQRLLHWSRAFVLTRDALPATFTRTWLDSMAAQTDYLHRNIEWHLMANHVHKNLHALFTATALFDNPRFRAARQRAAALLWREIREQVLPDAMHFERSPMYHADVLADTMEAAAIAKVTGVAVPDDVSALIPRMLSALRRLTRPDGTLHQFNDAANDARRLSPELLCDVTVEPGSWFLPDAGYFGCVNPTLRFVIDCGEPGPRHQSAHGHCDLLGFELDVNNTPFIVDSGTSGYDGDPLRSYMRSTRAHNTVEIAGLEQHELWGTFRVARRATVGSAHIDANGRFTGSYRPYHGRNIVHERSVIVRADGIDVEDKVAGSNGATVRSFLHLHPSVDVRIDDGRVTATSTAARARIELHNIADVRIITGRAAASGMPAQGWHAAEFGAAVPAPAIELTVADTTRPFGYRIAVS